MKTPDVILLAGRPWAGKTSIANEAVALGAEFGYSHLSIGKHMRDIRSGKQTSAYADRLDDRTLQYGPLKVLPADVMIGLFEEFIKQGDGAVAIVDGFPRFPDRPAPLRDSTRRLGISILGICRVRVEASVLHNRFEALSGTRDRVESDLSVRLAAHNDFIAPTLDLLAQEHTSFNLDGTLPIAENAERLFRICEDLRATK